jgi:hypothetical protein
VSRGRPFLLPYPGGLDLKALPWLAAAAPAAPGRDAAGAKLAVSRDRLEAAALTSPLPSDWLALFAVHEPIDRAAAAAAWADAWEADRAAAAAARPGGATAEYERSFAPRPKDLQAEAGSPPLALLLPPHLPLPRRRARACAHAVPLLLSTLGRAPQPSLGRPSGPAPGAPTLPHSTPSTTRCWTAPGLPTASLRLCAPLQPCPAVAAAAAGVGNTRAPKGPRG